MTSVDSGVPVSAAGLSPERLRLLELLGAPEAAQNQGGRSQLAISLFFFSANVDDDVRAKHRILLECAEIADDAGLHAIWVPERHFDPFGAPYPSPAVLLAAVAARTRRIALRAGSVVLPLHDPLLVAEEWGLLDSLSAGRAALSLASGWHTDDFVLNPDGYARRRDLLRERLEVLSRLWRGESVTRRGPDDRVVEVRVLPCPQSPPDVWLTSASDPETWRVAGELNLNVLTALLQQTLGELDAKVRVYRRALAEAGHQAAGRQVTCMMHTHLAADPEVVSARIRDPLVQYLSAHMKLFEKFAATSDIGVRPEDVTTRDREILLAHGVQRYASSAGLFGSAETCQPMLDQLVSAGVTEVGCLVDFGLPREQVLECVHELGRLRRRLDDEAERC
jgi:natural product biosynthesis luciferase-like monooxygenase protein